MGQWGKSEHYFGPFLSPFGGADRMYDFDLCMTGVRGSISRYLDAFSLEKICPFMVKCELLRKGKHWNKTGRHKVIVCLVTLKMPLNLFDPFILLTERREGLNFEEKYRGQWLGRPNIIYNAVHPSGLRSIGLWYVNLKKISHILKHVLEPLQDFNPHRILFETV